MSNDCLRLKMAEGYEQIVVSLGGDDLLATYMRSCWQIQNRQQLQLQRTQNWKDKGWLLRSRNGKSSMRRRDAPRNLKERGWNWRRRDQRFEDHQKWLTEQQNEKRKETRETKRMEWKKMETDVKQKQEEAATAELLGDVIRNSIIKNGDKSDRCHTISQRTPRTTVFYAFRPQNLQARLINPYLNDRAQRILGKFSAQVAGDYEYRLTPDTSFPKLYDIGSCYNIGLSAFRFTQLFSKAKKMCSKRALPRDRTVL